MSAHTPATFRLHWGQRPCSSLEAGHAQSPTLDKQRPAVRTVGVLPPVAEDVAHIYERQSGLSADVPGPF